MKQALRHTCHAIGCATEVPPERLMCLRHWRLVPRQIQKAVWATYRPGQCRDKKPSTEWIQAARAAIDAVQAKEKK